MKASDLIADVLKLKGVPCVFELAGGMITHLLDSFCRRGLRTISVHHEQSAAFAADAVGRITGIPGVAVATSGPGATNLITGIGSCFFDSSPAVFITGQVNRNEQKGSRPVRQLGFQETDIVTLARSLTKDSWQVQTPQEVPQALESAFRLAVSGRPGPVLLDIPMDVQRMEVDSTGARAEPEVDVPRPDASCLLEILSVLEQARRPIVLAGGGIRASRALAAFRAMVERLGLPVVHSLMAVDALPYGHPLRVGLIGTYGNRWANLALSRADAVVVIGSRLDIRQTGSDLASFAAGKTIYHIDIDPGEVNNRVSGCRAVLCDIRAFLADLSQACAGRDLPRCEPWLKEIAELKASWPDTGEQPGLTGINPNAFMHQLSQRLASAAGYVVDVGQHQMWAAQSLELGERQFFMTSGGMGSMGFALPAAMGASAAIGPSPVAVIAGDGGFQLNIQELETVSHNRLPLKMVIVDNRCYGMVRQFQEAYFDSRFQSTVWGYSAPDFARVASAYGIASMTVREPGEVPRGLDWLGREPLEPQLLCVAVSSQAGAHPKVAFGRALDQMEPDLKPSRTNIR